jgi:hypothetical protein
VLHVVHVIVLGVQEEGRRRVGADANVCTQAEVRPVAAVGSIVLRRPQVTGLDEYGEVRSATHLVGGIHRRICPLREVVLTEATRRPPAEKPITPILWGYPAHFPRSHTMLARCTSSSSLITYIIAITWHLARIFG